MRLRLCSLDTGPWGQEEEARFAGMESEEPQEGQGRNCVDGTVTRVWSCSTRGVGQGQGCKLMALHRCFWVSPHLKKRKKENKVELVPNL